ncbi:MAG: methyltransferase domain-containing protein, partial [Firmicutes bacterium]|nr:methyltransferase domain-containing protein [Bacillota bacterium]
MTLQKVFKICDKVLREGAFLENELNAELKSDKTDERFITALSYGVIDKSFEFDYVISSLCDKPVKKVLKTILKIGFYQLKYMDVAKYAAVDNTVELCKAVKKDNAGFINAVLKKFIDYQLVLPKDTISALSVKYSYPSFIVEKYLKHYKAGAEKILSYKESTLEHVRLICNKKEFINLLEKNDIRFLDSNLTNGVFCDYKKLLNSDISKNLYIGQNLGSMMIVDAMDLKKDDSVLDACAAPGGKSLYMASKCNKVLACDVSLQKIEKIQKNANRLNVKNVETKISDATVLQDLGKFDKVLCDVPCSGLGITYSKPDIKLHRTFVEIELITDIQKEILQTCKNYVKDNGFLMYSTCTL